MGVAKKQTEIVFKKSEVENLQHSIVVANTTTQTQLLDPTKIKLIEFLERGVVLRVPHGTCASGHILTLFFFPGEIKGTLRALPKDASEVKGLFLCTAKVTSLESPEKKWDVIHLSFYQFQEQEWHAFQKLYMDHQKRMKELVSRIKD